MTLTRRDFLKVFGVSTMAVVSNGFSLPAVLSAEHIDLRSAQARALHTAPIRELPSPEAPVIRHLWEDEVFDVQATVGRWMQSSEGFVAAHDAQPMLSIEPLRSPDFPYWAEVVGAAAAVRAWADDAAPLINKVGHGGVMRVLDHLTPRAAGGSWIAIADEHDHPVGWSRGELWSAIAWRATVNAELIIDAAQHRAALWEAEIEHMRADIAVGHPLIAGVYPITQLQPGVTVEAAGQTRLGVPYVQRAGNELSLGGVYWHNRFDALHDGLDLQLPVHIARAWFGRLRHVIIR